VRGRIAEKEGHRVPPVSLDHAVQPAINDGPGLRPGGLDQVPGGVADQRLPDAVGVVVQLAQCRALGADEPAAEHVVTVAADAHDLLAAVGARPQGDLQPAGRLAQRAGTQGRALSAHADMLPEG